MKQLTNFSETLLVVAMMLVASVCAQAQAQNAEEGKVVTIDADAGNSDFQIEEEVRVVGEPAYWIGVQGRGIESAVLRTHLQLAEDMGVVVEQVLDGSPAAKAGLRRHDIILRANGDTVDNMQVLQTQVRNGKDKPLELKIIRLGKKEDIVVVPELRPDLSELQAEAARQADGVQVQGGLMQQQLDQLMRQFGNRNIGPGMVFRGGGQAFNLNQMPNGVSVSVQRNNNEPAQITVKQGDQTWHIVGDDEESLKQLPDDLRPFVERMLKGQGNVQAFGGNLPQGFGGDFNIGNLQDELEKVLPDALGGLDRFGGLQRRKIDQHELELKQRMEQLEQRLLELQGRFEQGVVEPQD